MNYCPGCQEPLKGDEEQCPFCGYEIIATNKEEVAEKATPMPGKRPFYKSGAFIGSAIALVILAILVTGVIFGYNYYQESQENNFKKELEIVWLEVTNRTEQLISSLELVTDSSDLEDLKDELGSFSDFLAEKQTEVVNLETSPKYEANQQVLIDSIDKYNKYIYFLKLVVQKEVSQVGDADYGKIKTLADDSQGATDKFIAETAFVNDKLPSQIFKAIEKIRPLIEKAQADITNKQKQNQQQQLLTERKSAEATVRSFMQARIDKSAAEMRKYITPDYDKVFDPEQEFAVGDTYSIDFKITKTENKSPTEYEISGDELGKDLTGAKFTNKWWYKVVKFEGDWLIDNRKLLENGLPKTNP